jgi:hypothetical protein
MLQMSYNILRQTTLDTNSHVAWTVDLRQTNGFILIANAEDDTAKGNVQAEIQVSFDQFLDPLHATFYKEDSLTQIWAGNIQRRPVSPYNKAAYLLLLVKKEDADRITFDLYDLQDFSQPEHTPQNTQTPQPEPRELEMIGCKIDGFFNLTDLDQVTLENTQLQITDWNELDQMTAKTKTVMKNVEIKLVPAETEDEEFDEEEPISEIEKFDNPEIYSDLKFRPTNVHDLDAGFQIGQYWNQDPKQTWVCVDNSPGQADWQPLTDLYGNPVVLPTMNPVSLPGGLHIESNLPPELPKPRDIDLGRILLQDENTAWIGVRDRHSQIVWKLIPNLDDDPETKKKLCFAAAEIHYYTDSPDGIIQLAQQLEELTTHTIFQQTISRFGNKIENIGKILALFEFEPQTNDLPGGAAIKHQTTEQVQLEKPAFSYKDQGIEVHFSQLELEELAQKRIDAQIDMNRIQKFGNPSHSEGKRFLRLMKSPVFWLVILVVSLLSFGIFSQIEPLPLIKDVKIGVQAGKTLHAGPTSKPVTKP